MLQHPLVFIQGNLEANFTVGNKLCILTDIILGTETRGYDYKLASHPLKIP